MRLFAELYFALDTTSDSEVKIRALTHYLRQAPPEDAIWALCLLLGKRPRRILSLEELQQLAREAMQLPDWLIEESLRAVKDLLEAVTLLLPLEEDPEDLPLHIWLDKILPGLRDEEQQSRDEKIRSSWEQMDFQERFVWNKLLSGGFRLPLPNSLIVKALSMVSGLEAHIIAYRLKQKWDTSPEAYHALIAPDDADASASRPYAFSSRQVLDKGSIHHSDIQHWHIEWDWDGLRIQCIKRQGQFFLWSEEINLLTDKLPELHEFGQNLSDGTVIEATIVAWQNERPLPGEKLQARLRRKHLTKKLLQETPIRGFVVDVLEDGGRDFRHQPFSQRRKRLTNIMKKYSEASFSPSPTVQAYCWAELDRAAECARENGATGLSLIPLDAAQIGDANSETWWIWKAHPLTILAVLLYVQRRQGPSLTPVTEYSLGVWDGDRLVKIAAGTAEFSKGEQEEIDLFVKENTIERFGPVRSVKAELVFELSFEGILKSPRHKAGLKLENPRIIRWCRDKHVEDIGALTDLRGLVCEEKDG